MKRKKNKNESARIGDATFDQVRGYHDEVSRLKAVAYALVASRDFNVFPKGIMFSGQPGTGKTTLAKAFINETGFPCFSPGPCPDADALARLYDDALKEVPSIVFLDDVDRILSIEGSDGFVSDESRSCLKELLARLDGAENSLGVITVMTTNEYYSLDDAVKRSGRVDLHIPIDRPNDSDREEILAFYMSQYPDFFPIDDKQFLSSLAQKCHGLSCADLKLIVKDVYLLNYQASSEGSAPDFVESFQTRIMEMVNGGLLKRICKNEDDILRICYHEAGHAIVDWVLNSRASDICTLQSADGNVGGWSAPRQNDYERKFYREKECVNEISTYLAGMAAEAYYASGVSVGAASDLTQAMILVKSLLSGCLTGTFEFVPAVLPSIQPYFDNDNQTDEFIAKVQLKEQTILNTAYSKAFLIVSRYKSAMEAMCLYLKTNGFMSAEKLISIFERHAVPKGGGR